MSLGRASGRLERGCERRSLAAGVRRSRSSSVRSPVGLVYFGMSDRGLCDVTFGLRRDVDYRRRLGHRVPEIWRDDATLREVRAEFVAYFDGRTRKFSIPTDLRGVTPFVQASAGETTSVWASDQLWLLGWEPRPTARVARGRPCARPESYPDRDSVSSGGSCDGQAGRLCGRRTRETRAAETRGGYRVSRCRVRRGPPED